MSERTNIDRMQGDPIEFHVDLKWSLWTRNPETFKEYAPQTFAHLEGAVNGEQEESGETLVIYTAPRKEIRYGSVTIDPRTNTVAVFFRAEFDDDSVISKEHEFPVPDTLEELLGKVDAVEDSLIVACQIFEARG